MVTLAGCGRDGDCDRLRSLRAVAARQQRHAHAHRGGTGQRPLGVAHGAFRSLSERGVAPEIDPRTSRSRPGEQLLLRHRASHWHGDLSRLAVAASSRSISAMAQHGRDLHGHRAVDRDDSRRAATTHRRHRPRRHCAALRAERVCRTRQRRRRPVRRAAVHPCRLGIDHRDRLRDLQHKPLAMDRRFARRAHDVRHRRDCEPLLVRWCGGCRRTRLRLVVAASARSSKARSRDVRSGSGSYRSCGTTCGHATGCK